MNSRDQTGAPTFGPAFLSLDRRVALPHPSPRRRPRARPSTSRAVDADIDVPAPAGLAYLPFQRAGIAYLSGRWSETSEHAREALATLPRSEVLLAARVATRGAQAAARRGAQRESAVLYARALQMDPGTIRRLGAALPVRFEPAEGPAPRNALRHLRASPRFAPVPLRAGGDLE